MTNGHHYADASLDEARADRFRVTDRDAYLLVALEVAVMLLWALWQLVDIDLQARGAAATREITLTAIVLTTTLAVAASYALLWALRRRGLRAWTAVAVTALLISCAGPLLATSLAASLALLSFHLLVGVGLIAGVRYLHGTGR
jgi:hypothetical protein